MNRENIMRAALSDLEAQRANNIEVERKRREEACAKSPEIAQLLDIRQKLFYSSMRNAFSSPEKAKQISNAMKLEMEKINRKLRVILQKNGFPEDFLQPVYRCPLCKDTGYVGEPVHEPCACLKRAVLNKLYQNEGLQGLEYQNFSTFDESIFPDTIIEGKKLSQRAYIQKYRVFCEEYANSFKPGEGKGLLLCGRSGLGKTFLMNCVAQRVLELGYSVVVISAYKLVELMRNYQFDGKGAEQVLDILTCDLLAIDDLGSEPMLRGVTLSAIYHIVNERNNANRAIVVTTNCSSELLYEKYDDRIAARLTAPSKMSVIEFMGVDVRRYVR